MRIPWPNISALILFVALGMLVVRHHAAIGEGMSFVNGAPWNTQDAVAERTEAVSP